MVVASKIFIAGSTKHSKWVPGCPGNAVTGDDGRQYEDFPAMLASWSQDAKEVILGPADVRLQADTGAVTDCAFKNAFGQSARVTDLQIAKFDEDFLFVTSNDDGTLSWFSMYLPSELPGATTADLAFSHAEEDPHSLLMTTQQLHKGPAASVDINTVRQVLLSVSGDGSICLVPGPDLHSASAAAHTFKQSSGWSGYSQGRWVDSHIFATSGVSGGLQLWDERHGPRPVSRSSNSWGHTGCGLMDRQMGPLRQLLCLDVHPSRPTLAATGSSGGTVAIWDLRFHSAPLALTGSRPTDGDVTQCKFDLYSPQSTAAVPPVLYSTMDGFFCVTQDAAPAAAAEAAMPGSSWADDSSSSSSGGLVARVLHKEAFRICSFDVEPTYGRSVLAATDNEHILVLQLDEHLHQM